MRGDDRDVLPGRPERHGGETWFFGLAADGERGVAEVLDAYRVSIDRTLIGLGKSPIHELTADDLVVPEGYFLQSASDLPLAS